VAGAKEEVQFASKTPEEYSITYDVAKPGIIFVSETFYPGWVATGARTKLIEVFGAFQGIIIPEAGRGQVVVRFAPSVLNWGSPSLQSAPPSSPWYWHSANGARVRQSR